MSPINTPGCNTDITGPQNIGPSTENRSIHEPIQAVLIRIFREILQERPEHTTHQQSSDIEIGPDLHAYLREGSRLEVRKILRRIASKANQV